MVSEIIHKLQTSDQFAGKKNTVKLRMRVKASTNPLP